MTHSKKTVLGVFAFLLIQVGCGSSGNNNSRAATPATPPPAAAPAGAPGPVPSPTPTPASQQWSSLTEHKTCEALANTNCQGYYGFTVDSTGLYTVGPTPTGQNHQGNITMAEYTQLSAAADAVVLSGVTGAAQCTPTPSIPGVTDNVDLMTPDGSSSRIYDQTLAQTCYLGGQAAVQTLHQELSALLKEYYPVPFP